LVSDSPTLETFVGSLREITTEPAREGYAKIRLNFLTNEPKHIRSEMLRRICGSKPPFVEDVCVLMPLHRVFSILETFIPVFERLQETGVVSTTANLLGFKVLDEDITTLAYPSE
jgi:hypothetical protein